MKYSNLAKDVIYIAKTEKDVNFTPYLARINLTKRINIQIREFFPTCEFTAYIFKKLNCTCNCLAFIEENNFVIWNNKWYRILIIDYQYDSSKNPSQIKYLKVQGELVKYGSRFKDKVS